MFTRKKLKAYKTMFLLPKRYEMLENSLFYIHCILFIYKKW